MKRWATPAAIGLACLTCCLPFLLPTIGLTAGTGGAVTGWLAGNEVLVVAGVGFTYLTTAALVGRPHRPTQLTGRRVLP